MSENENEVVSRHGELKYRLRQRLTQEIFDCMPEKIQDYFIQTDPTDLKEAYISTMLRLPWTAGNAVPEIDLVQAKERLDRFHFGLTDVKEKALRYMACQKYLGKNYGAVLLLAGPPGVGKTSVAASIASAMGRPCVKISLAGVSDALFLRGTQTIFNSAKPGRIVEALIHAESFCPVILLDEIDKMGSSVEHGCPESVLLDILDSDRSKFVDNYLGFPLDLSNVIFIATANDLEPLSPILKDRMDIVELPPYSPQDKEKIVEEYVWPSLTREYHLEGLKLREDAVDKLIEMCPEEGVRDLQRICRKLCESVISFYYVEQHMMEEINTEMLEKLLGAIYYK